MKIVSLWVLVVLFWVGASRAMVPMDARRWFLVAARVDWRIQVRPFGRSVHFLGELFQPMSVRQVCDLDRLMSIEDPVAFAACKQWLAAQYKIHVMLDPAHIEAAVTALLTRLRDNPLFAQSLYEMKLLMNTPDVEYGKLLPMIVLYPLPGREHAQQVAEQATQALEGIPPLTIEHISEKQVPFLEYSSHAPEFLCPRDNLLFSGGRAGHPQVCYAQGGGVFKEERVVVVNTKDDTFDVPVYRQPSSLSGMYVFDTNDIAYMFGYAYGAYLSNYHLASMHDMAREMSATLSPEMPSSSEAFVFHWQDDPSKLKVRQLVAEFLYHRRPLTDYDIVPRIDRLEQRQIERAAGDVRLLDRAALAALQKLSERPLFNVIAMGFDKVVPHLHQLLGQAVMGPVPLADLLFDMAENKAIYRSDFLDDGPHDFHLHNFIA